MSTIPASSVERIEALLRQHGATYFAYGLEDGRFWIAWHMLGRRMRVDMPIPDPEDPIFMRTPEGRVRHKLMANRAYVRLVRGRMRSLLVWLKVTLEACNRGVLSFEQAFMGSMLDDTGHPVLDVLTYLKTWDEPVELAS